MLHKSLRKEKELVMSKTNNTVNITREDFKELKRLYKKTPDKGVLVFKDQEVLKQYAKHMIDYLEQRLGGT